MTPSTPETPGIGVSTQTVDGTGVGVSPAPNPNPNPNPNPRGGLTVIPAAVTAPMPTTPDNGTSVGQQGGGYVLVESPNPTSDLNPNPTPDLNPGPNPDLNSGPHPTPAAYTPDGTVGSPGIYPSRSGTTPEAPGLGLGSGLGLGLGMGMGMGMGRANPNPNSLAQGALRGSPLVKGTPAERDTSGEDTVTGAAASTGRTINEFVNLVMVSRSLTGHF